MPHTERTISWVKRNPASGQIECLEGYFEGVHSRPHRHDSYALAQTLAGVHAVRYRGRLWHSGPGSVILLHPDELHDSRAGNDHGVHFRLAYIAPSLIQQILGGRPLPFVPSGVPADPALHLVARALLQAPAHDTHDMSQDDALFELTRVMTRLAGERDVRRKPDFPAAERARTYIHDCLPQEMTLDALARAAGVSRWRLCRDFRLLYGTSPSRYVLLRRLETARTELLAGTSISDAARISGFSDQSHLTRLFSLAYGVSPGRWLRSLVR